MQILIFVFILGIMIFGHELGHFIMAKRAGIKVEEFGFGFPPRLIGFRRGETLYSLNLIPAGAFVRLLGEDDPAHPRSFAGARRLWRTIVLFAGPLMNLLLGVLVFSGSFIAGAPTVTSSQVPIFKVLPDSPADRAGI